MKDMTDDALLAMSIKEITDRFSHDEIKARYESTDVNADTVRLRAKLSQARREWTTRMNDTVNDLLQSGRSVGSLLEEVNDSETTTNRRACIRATIALMEKD